MDMKQWLVEWFSNNSSLAKEKIIEGITHNYLKDGWIDSFKFISLITELEEHFMMKFTDTDFNSDGFSNIEGLARIISSKTQAASEKKTNKKTNEKALISRGNYKSAPLFMAGGKKIFYSDFVNALNNLGVRKGDVLFVYSDISVFGTLAANGKEGEEMVLQALVEALKEAVGKSGTLILPTFSYSFCDNQIFDVQNSPSKVGVLTEYFRKLPGTIRTVQPIYSVSLWGKHKKELSKVSNDCFGKDSVFGTSHRLGCKLLFLGADFQACTQIHYVEQAHKVPYRFFKTFTGTIKDYDKERESSCTFYVRYLDREVITLAARFKQYLLDKKLLKKAKVGFGALLLVGCDTYFKEGMKKLDDDIYFFLKHPPKEIKEK